MAHSLGCVTALRYLARHPEIKGANLVLVGAFVDPLPTYPSLDAYMAGELDLKDLQPQLHRATVIVAKDDYVAPYQLGVAVAKGLGAKLIVQDRGGHFLTSDGYEQFPLVLINISRKSRDFSHGMDRPLLSPFMGLFVCFCIFLGQVQNVGVN